MINANGYKELLRAVHECTQTVAEEILSIGVLYNLKIKISGKISLLTEYLKEDEIKQLYRSDIIGLHACLMEYLENGQPIQIQKETIPKQPPYYVPRVL